MERIGSPLIEQLTPKQPQRVVTLYRSMVGSFDVPPLTDRALLLAARCAAFANDFALSLQATRYLMVHHARSPLIPCAMWDAAEVQRRAGYPQKADKTLGDLVRAYPRTRYAEQARAELSKH